MKIVLFLRILLVIVIIFTELLAATGVAALAL